MAWTDEDKAKRVNKFMKCGLLYPEDINRNELRLLRQYRPKTYHFVKTWLEFRQKQIERGDWSKQAEPPHTDIRINRLDKGKSIVDPYER